MIGVVFVIVGKMKTCNCDREEVFERPISACKVGCCGMKCDNKEVYLLLNDHEECRQVIYLGGE